MSDLGVVSTSANQMTMRMAASDLRGANRTFATVQLFLGCVTLGLFLVTSVVLTLWSILRPEIEEDIPLAVAALAVAVLLTLVGGLGNAVFRSTNRYATGEMLYGCARLLEWGGYIVGLYAFGSFGGVALVGLLGRTVGLLILLLSARPGAYGLHWGFREASRAELRDRVRPAASFMAFPLGDGISLQGLTLVVAAVFGPATVAIFSAYRTLSRLVLQAVSVLSHTLWPEFSRLKARHESEASRSLYVRSVLASVVIAFVLSLGFLLAGPKFLEFWTRGSVPVAMGLFIPFAFYALTAATWQVPKVALMAVDRHGVIGVSYLLTSTCVVVGAVAFGLSTDELEIVAWLVVVGEVPLAVVAFRGANVMLKSALVNGMGVHGQAVR